MKNLDFEKKQKKKKKNKEKGMIVQKYADYSVFLYPLLGLRICDFFFFFS